MNSHFLNQAIFWISASLIIWTYFGYLAFLKILSIYSRRDVTRGNGQPDISLIVTAYNEEKRIKEKIENCLSLNYPKDKIEIIVVSDGSTDRTVEIADSFEDDGVIVVALPERSGKHHGQGEGIRIALNDILVLTDATTMLAKDALINIAANFSDPTIGCVSGMDIILDDSDKNQGEGAYVRYEMALRDLEGIVNSLVGVSGSFFAVRKQLCENWIGNLSSDFYLPIIARTKNYRTVLDKRAVGYYTVLDDQKREFTRKVRTVVHGMEVLFRFRGILNPLKYGMFSIQMLSHKLSRWLVPFYLILLLLSNLLLVGTSSFYLLTFFLQLVFYFLAASACFFSELKSSPVFKIPFFFVMVNYSILVAWSNFILGRDFVVWDPTKR